MYCRSVALLIMSLRPPPPPLRTDQRNSKHYRRNIMNDKLKQSYDAIINC